jgi:ATP-dependent Lhr-like helicase
VSGPAHAGAASSPAVALPETAAERLLAPLFAARGWTPLPFQRAAWRAFADRRSGLITVPTGSGKTLAAVGGPLAEIATADDGPGGGLQLLYLTPLRAVARDVETALREAVTELELPLRVESRTGDTSSAVRKRQREAMPEVLVTTPESLSVLLSYRHARRSLGPLRAVVVDEWHELLGSKRGTLLELALARVRALAPRARTWALSATLANPDEAAVAACGARADRPTPTLIRADVRRETRLTTLLPARIDAFPWGGHLGRSMVPRLVETLDRDRSTLIFVNTRRQAELWHQDLRAAVPEMADAIALHHGSVDRAERERVEAGVKDGSVRWVVATSSLDLGVDFQPVERVVQIGSAKAVARLLQRAGRSAHVPHGRSEVLFVPTHALELLEAGALRRALDEGTLEPRTPLAKPYDVLAQHLATLACGDGFDLTQLDADLADTAAYRDLTDEERDAVLEVVTHGGRALHAYESFRRVVREADGRYRIASTALARRHSMQIGTITSDQAVQLRFANGRALGTVEESFVAKLRKGDVFVFAGRTLELIALQGLRATVRTTRRSSTATPAWRGGRLPISERMGRAIRGALEDPDGTPEGRALAPLLEVQARVSAIPTRDEVLIETTDTREGRHLFLFPVEGRRVHEGLAALLAIRLGRRRPGTFAYAANDLGLTLAGPRGYPFDELVDDALFAPDGLEDDLREAVDVGEAAGRRFRDVAQIAGLVFLGYPGSRKSGRQLQMSTGTLYGALRRYDPQHPLLAQAERELLDDQLESPRLRRALERLGAARRVTTAPRRVSPFAFPLFVDRMAAKLSTETLEQRVARLVERWSDA